MVLPELGAPGPGVPGHQDVDDDQADGEDCQHSAHRDGDQHLQLTVLVDPQLQGVSLRPECVLHVDLEGPVVLGVGGEDGQPGDVAVVVTGEAVEAVGRVPPVAGARG